MCYCLVYIFYFIMQESYKINVLIIGSGGREHALAWSTLRSPILNQLYVTNDIYATDNNVRIAKINCDNALNIALFCKQADITLVIIGPEKYLAAGLADELTAEGILVFGPGKVATQLESSKSFTKDICKMNNIPTAKYAYFSDAELAKKYVQNRQLPIVVKVDGLAAGKGVLICQTLEEAENAIDDILCGKFGEAGSTIVIEEYLVGTEISFFALFDGNNVVACGSAQDRKAITYGDKTYNTGGMGTCSPSPNITSHLENTIMRKIIYPTANALNDMKIQFKGVLFSGIMLTKGGPKLLEYNVRFGDPEIQSLIPRLKTDLLTLMLKTASGKLQNDIVEWHDRCSVCIVMASDGYPLDYKKGTVIKGLEKLEKMENVLVFHAGTKIEDGKVIANGGRVLNIVAYAKTMATARKKAYAAVELIDWPEGIYIKDIAASS